MADFGFAILDSRAKVTDIWLAARRVEKETISYQLSVTALGSALHTGR